MVRRAVWNYADGIMGERWTALVVHEPSRDVGSLRAALESLGAHVLCACSATEALQLEVDAPCTLAVVDWVLPGESGRVVLEALREAGGRTPVVMIAAADAVERAALFDAGADDVLAPDVPVLELTARLRRRLDHARQIQRLDAEVRRLHELSVTDGLTQLANHRHFQERLHEEFRRAQRYDDPLALILLDVDHFKQLNDTYGHQFGDEVLRAFADCLRRAVRETDFVARYGGEEFAVLLPKTHLGGALTVAERIARALHHLRLGQQRVAVTASLGISSYPSRTVTTPEHLIRTADDALYRSKHEGRNKISLHQPAVALSTGATGTRV
jgi:diguanylate cyclase (GGDEF)-like protein